MSSFKITDLQNVACVVPTGGKVLTPKTVTHGLKNELGAYVNPDEVHIELISSGGGAGHDENIRLQVTRPGVPNGAITLNGETDAANASGSDWTYVFRVSCKYYHSIQSKDHTP